MDAPSNHTLVASSVCSLCVQVKLDKPLLAMFELKERVDTKGLHMLYHTCGKFGHYINGCPKKGFLRMEHQNLRAQHIFAAA
ncbi:hypothetical protein TSUD_11350 [Trifolium subterraneum]|nr:hypothetical protein TSUD_11350 [Trifolium subterraneum]